MSVVRYIVAAAAVSLVACRTPGLLGSLTDKVKVRVGAAGTGDGTVQAPLPVVGINCTIVNGASTAGTCSAEFEDIGQGGTFTLVASESEDSEFVSWTGCTLTNGTICILQFSAGESPDFAVIVTFRRRNPSAVGFNAELLRNESFEDSVEVGGLPATVGAWRGDVARSVLPVPGVPAIDGARVLQFVRTGPSIASATGESSQQWQLVDVSSLAAAIDSGKVRAIAKARFASVPGDAQTDRRFDLRVGAYRGTPNEFPVSYASPAGVRLAAPTATVLTASTGAWLPAEVSFILPAGTRYLAVEIYAFEDVFNDATDPELDGHFADEASLILRRLQ